MSKHVEVTVKITDAVKKELTTFLVNLDSQELQDRIIKKHKITDPQKLTYLDLKMNELIDSIVGILYY